MAKINTHYQKLQAGYLFPEIGKRVRTYAAAHPEARIIRLGIGDVVLPLPAPIVLGALPTVTPASVQGEVTAIAQEDHAPRAVRREW